MPRQAAPGVGPSALWDPAARTDPHEVHARIRRAGRPVLQVDPGGNRLWVVARHADVRAALTCAELGHEVDRHRPDGCPGTPAPRSRAERVVRRELLSLDPPDHTRLRALVNRAFTARTVAAMGDRVQALADDLVGRAASRSGFDGVRDVAARMPDEVIAALVGIPPEDRRRFRAWSAVLVAGAPGAAATTEALAGYVDALAGARRLTPRDDLLSQLVRLEDDEGRLDRDELVALVRLLVVAGQETTVHVVATTLRLLLSHPEQWDDVVAEPGLVPSAVEESVRFHGPVEIAPPRWTFAPLVLGGGTVPALERVGLSLWGANRDPEVFASPERFDVHRLDAGSHLAFGYGPHHCLGAALGRLQAAAVLHAFRRLAPATTLAVDRRVAAGVLATGGVLPLRSGRRRGA